MSSPRNSAKGGVVTNPLSESVMLARVASQAERDHSGIGEALLTQATNGLDADLDMCGDLQYADPVVVGLPELSAPSREKVSKIVVAPRNLT